MEKKPLAWVVDSTAFITDELKNHPDVYVIPLNIHFGDQQYQDGIDLTPEELYQKIETAEEFPKTSQPAAGEFAKVFESISERYDAAIAVHLTAKLSGTLASSMAGAEMTDFPVHFVDSNSLSVGITRLVERGMELAETGKSPEEIAETLKTYTSNFRNYILIGELDQLYKGGRMSGVQFFLGSMLKIKPIVQITPEGELQAIDKVRSEKKAMQYLVDRISESYQNDGISKVYLMHGGSQDKADELQASLKEQVPSLEVVTGDISSTLGVHAGRGTVAALWFVEKD
ncbi:DegV family protein [Chungangia koreensis]|uniref:DegV family protein n=1 Tax=Chungangia koreensis TaxID=752657 RepID=A0ABV8X5G0_9LACT